jgi:hypothetical protein
LRLFDFGRRAHVSVAQLQSFYNYKASTKLPFRAIRRPERNRFKLNRYFCIVISL